MICPRLLDLPSPPKGKTGWPWTEESGRLADRASDGKPRPRISVITPSFNQGKFLEETIRSILLQGYPDLEYFILDGGSADGSVEIIKKYSRWISYWGSEADGGQSDAINRGLKQATGEFATWINSDDLLCKNALVDQVSRYGCSADTVYVGKCVYIDASSNILSVHQGRVHTLEDLVRVRTVWRSDPQRGHIVQPEVLFPRALAISVGGLNPDNHRTMDYEFWGRLLLAGAIFRYTDIQFGMFRQQPNQKTRDVLSQTESLLLTAESLIHQARCFTENTKREILADLRAHEVEAADRYWKGTGRLARLPLSRASVTRLRSFRTVLEKTAKTIVKAIR